MKVDGGRGKLYDAHKVIRHQWDEVSEHWADTVRAEFEEKILDAARSACRRRIARDRSAGPDSHRMPACMYRRTVRRFR